MLKMTWNGEKVENLITSSAVVGLLKASEYLLQESNKITPIDEGTLRNSGETSIDEANLEATILYNTPYAVRLHEHPEYNFKHGKQGKWLENTLKDKGDTAMEILNNEIHKVVGE